MTGRSPAAVEHGPVERLLLGRRGQALGDHELQFGAEQADAGGAGLLEMRQVDEEPGIHVQADLDAVARHGRHVAQAPILLLTAGAQARLLGIGRLARRAADGSAPRRGRRRR